MATNDDSRVLLANCRKGHQGAYRSLFNQHFDYVYRVARKLGTPEAEAEDVCQEVFLVVFRKLDDFTHGRFTTWLYRITANVVADRHKKRRRRRAFTEVWQREPHKLFCQGADQDYDAREAEQLVNEVLNRMKPKKREVFALYELAEMSGEEIADLLGCKVDTVWTRLHHARKDFAKLARKGGLGGWSGEAS